MVAAFASGVATAAYLSEPTPTMERACEQVGQSQFLPAVPEASGIALADGVLWAHNDSDAPVLYRIDRSGRPAPVTVAGAEVRDWEDLASMSGGLCAGRHHVDNRLN